MNLQWRQSQVISHKRVAIEQLFPGMFSIWIFQLNLDTWQKHGLYGADIAPPVSCWMSDWLLDPPPTCLFIFVGVGVRRRRRSGGERREIRFRRHRSTIASLFLFSTIRLATFFWPFLPLSSFLPSLLFPQLWHTHTTHPDSWLGLFTIKLKARSSI